MTAPRITGLISGQVGRAVLFHGDTIKVFDLSVPDTVLERRFTETTRVFWGATDLGEIEVADQNEVVPLLRSRQHQDRALILFLMLIDREEDDKIKQELLVTLNDLLEESSVAEFLADRLFKAPLDESSNLDRALQISAQYSHITLILTLVGQHQRVIQRVRSAWEALPDALYADEDDKETVELAATDLGVFRMAACAIFDKDHGAMNAAKFEFYNSAALKGVRGYREIVRQWLDPLTPAKNDREGQASFKGIVEPEWDEDEDVSRYPRRLIPDYEAYQRALAQVFEIKKLVQHLELDKARRFTQQLVNAQIRNEDQQYAAMSLCNIAAYAQDARQDSFALELTKQAIEIMPQDGWSWGQLGEAYFRLSRYDEALAAFAQAEVYGEACFVATAKARMLRHQGKLDDAFAMYEEAAKKFEESEDVWNALCGIADIYRCRHEYETALALLDDALARFPIEPLIWYAKGSIFLEIGEFRQSRETFEEAVESASAAPENLMGIGQVHLEAGDTEAAIAAFKKVRKRYPDNPNAYRWIAYALRSEGKLREALSEYSYMKMEFPYDYTGWLGAGDTYRELRDFTRASMEFQEAIRLFPNDAQPKLKTAQLYKSMNQLEKALQAYSSTCANFPTNIFAKLGQANLFKELGRYDSALTIYKEIPNEAWQFQPEVRNSFAAIYVAQGKFDKALELLPEINPRTKSEWVAHHIRGMVLLKSGKLGEAIKHFENALKTIPFPSNKLFFENALATAKLRDHDFKAAADMLADRKGPVTHLLQLHAYAGLNDYAAASFAYNALQNDCPENIIPIRDELGAHMKLNEKAPERDSDWIFKHECNILALSVSIDQLAA